MSLESFVFCGTGGKKPFLGLWDNPLKKDNLHELVNFPEGNSVYSICISPKCSKVLAITKQGLITAFEINSKYRIAENQKPIFKCYHTAPLTSACFFSEDRFASAGIDGKVKIWSINKQSFLFCSKIHENGVFSLCPINLNKFASIGADNKLKIGRLDFDKSLYIPEYESDFFSLPRIKALTSIVYNPKKNYLIHPSQDGLLFIYNLSLNPIKRFSVKAHKGDLCAIAYGGVDGKEKLLTAGLEDKTLRIWSQDLNNLITEIELNKGALSISCVGKDGIVIVKEDGIAQTFEIIKSKVIRAGRSLVGYDIRIVHGLNPAQLSELFTKKRITYRNKLLEEAQNIINNIPLDGASEKLNKELFSIINKLYSIGYHIESNLVYADALQALNKPLEELKVRIEIYNILENTDVAVPNMYALAKLLISLNEIDRAKKVIENLFSLEPDYLDTKELNVKIKLHPLNLVTIENGIYDIGRKKAHIFQEIQKSSLLNQKHKWKTLLIKFQPLVINKKINKFEVIDPLYEMVRSDYGDMNVDLDNFQFIHGEKVTSKYMICIISRDYQGIIYALNLQFGSSECKFKPFGIFDPTLLVDNQDIHVEGHNSQIRDLWLKYIGSSQIQQWLEEINNNMLTLLLKVIKIKETVF